MLALFLCEHPDELRADFQQFYGLDLDDIGYKYTYLHAGVLAAQLPRESRVVRVEEPAANWGYSEALLSAIEYWTHCIAYSYSGDAKHHRNEPRPIDPPAKENPRKRKTNISEVKRLLAMPRKEVSNGN